MNGREFLQFFIGGFLGGLIYELIVYFSDPYDVVWLDMLFEVTIVAAVIAVTITLFRRFSNRDSQNDA